MSITRREALTSAQEALKIIRNRMELNASYGVYIHANEQLIKIVEILLSPSLPDDESRNFVDIGLMAAKELEADDAELADALMAADYDFKHVS